MTSKKILFAVLSLGLLAVGIAIPWAAGPEAADALSPSPEGIMRTNLATQGLGGAIVRVTDGALQITLQSRKGGAPEDAWSRMLIEREAAFLAKGAQPTVDRYELTILDESGDAVFRRGSPLESRSRPARQEIENDVLTTLSDRLVADGREHGVEVRALSAVVDTQQGLIVDGSATIDFSSAAERDEQLRWATVEQLGQIRDYCEGLQGLGVDLYRLAVSDGDGKPLVSYVVDPEVRATRAWFAEGLEPVWR